MRKTHAKNAQNMGNLCAKVRTRSFHHLGYSAPRGKCGGSRHTLINLRTRSWIEVDPKNWTGGLAKVILTESSPTDVEEKTLIHGGVQGQSGLGGA